MVIAGAERVVLSAVELALVAEAAAAMHADARSRGHVHDTSLGSAPMDLNGRAGECALWSWLYPGLPWQPSGWREPDVPPDFEARTTAHRLRTGNGARYLTLREKDPVERRWVLVWGDVAVSPAFELVGWIEGRIAKVPQYKRAGPSGATIYAVPEYMLRPMRELVT